MKRLKFSLAYLFTALALLTSCIDEDLTDCQTGVRVYFSYDLPSSQGIFSLDVSRITLLAFDASGRYVGEWIDEAPVLTQDYYMTVPLARGDYSFVAYAGLVSPYTLTPASPVTGTTLWSDMLLRLDTRSDGAVTTKLTELYHGTNKDIEVRPSASGQIITIPLVENTNRIHVTVEGLNDRSGDYRLRIDDKNGDYTLDNAFASTRELFYATLFERNTQKATLEASLTVLRLARDRKYPVLSVREETSDKTYYEESLIDLLLALESQTGTIDFDTTHDYYIVLSFDANLNLTVSINGWIVVEQSGPLS